MAKFNKPTTLNKIWAQAGDNSAPSDAKINLGWVSEVPPRQFFNFLDNKQDQALAAINQSGIPEWDNVTEYIGNFSHVLGSNGTVYKCVLTHTNINPVTDTANTAWVIAFAPANGQVQIDGKLVLPDGSATDPSYSFKNQTNSGLFLGSGASVVVTVAGVEKARFSQSSITLGQAVSLAANSTTTTPISGDSSTKIATTAFVADAVQDAATFALGVGAVIIFPMNTLPSGYLECNGQAVSRTVYADLFAVLGVQYGVGDGITTFNLPDYRGEFIRGWDNGRGVDAGRSLGSTQNDSFKSHTHAATTEANGLHNHTIGGGTRNFATTPGGSVLDSGNDVGFTFGTNQTDSAGSHSHTVSVSSTGGSETRPRNVSVKFAIKF